MRAAAITLVGLLASASPVEAASSFQLAREDGNGWVSAGDLNERPSVFLFWDTRCPPCIVELGNTAALQRRFPEAAFVVVSLSPRDESRRVLARIKLPNTVMQTRAPSDPRGLLANLGNPAAALPFAAAFDPLGQQCARVSGALSTDQVTALRLRCRSRSDKAGMNP